jgi:hypothetical protein
LGLPGDLFARARSEVLELMARDTYARFRTRPAFEALLAAVGSYSDQVNRGGGVGR